MAVYTLPAITAFVELMHGGVVRQLLAPSLSFSGTRQVLAAPHDQWSTLTSTENGYIVLAAPQKADFPAEFPMVLKVSPNGFDSEATGAVDLAEASWQRHPLLSSVPQRPIDYRARVDESLASWADAFSYKLEDPAKGTGGQPSGLRPPQLGAVHAIQAHWTVSDEPATIVMPTGTGKTETMLCTLILARCPRVLVVVPTDALRTQTVSKFLTLGVLKRAGVVAAAAAYPIVGSLTSMPRTPDEVDEFFNKCNVIVTTMAIAGRCGDEIQRRMAERCPYLLVDEAHHIAAHTWAGFRHQFEDRRILQFTATPFRTDDKQIDGKIIFNFPLRRAQQQGYFRPIHFEPVREYRAKNADEVIAKKAVEQLRADNLKYRHILMARTADTKRAGEVFALYQKYPEFNPVQLHTGIKSKRERDRIRQQIIDGKAKIVVCVDMLGEGFDLPELKIAAFHDIHKSLAITLQLAGRFTRARSDLGDPTFIANIADVNVRDELKKLYARDADWNLLLPQSSEQAIQAEIDLKEFMQGFANPPEDLSLANLRPAMSTVIYRTQCTQWHPENFMAGIEGADSLELIRHAINYERHTLIIVTARKVPIDWGQIQEVFNWDWELFVVFWDEAQKLLFINSSSNRGYYGKLAEAVAAPVELMKGQPVFRCFAGINRLTLQNVGLIRQLGRLIRYSMQAGADVEPGLSEAMRQNARKGNMFGTGYEDGDRTSIGCSYKGRIWSRRVTSVAGLTDWCSEVGAKVLDESIDPDEVLKGTLVPVIVPKRPETMPIGVEWPDVFYTEPETVFRFVIDGQEVELYETELRLKEPSADGPLRFELCTDTTSLEFVLNLGEGEDGQDYSFKMVGSHHGVIERGMTQMSIASFFEQFPPVLWFADGSSLTGNWWTSLHKAAQPYPKDKIEAWDWSGVNIRKESQGVSKRADSIQRRVIDHLLAGDYDVIFDDDSSGEAADVVTVRDTGERVEIEFYHCKFSIEDQPGARIDDLYTVCGQAQKSVHWKRDLDALFGHLQRREPKREGADEATRFEKGDSELLAELAMKCGTCRPSLGVTIVQPGVSKVKVSEDQLALLSVTETYLLETYQLAFRVITSK